MMKYIIAECLGTKDGEGNLPNNLTCHRALYFYNYETKKPVGLPIMFLRDFGMEAAAKELVDLANKASND